MLCSSSMASFTLDDTGNKYVRHMRFIPRPVLPILHRASVVIPTGPMHEEDKEIDGIEVGHRRVKPCASTPSKACRLNE